MSRSRCINDSDAFAFVNYHFPADEQTVAGFFRRRGAYGHFKRFLAARGALQRWYDFEERATEEKGSDVNLGVHLVRDAFKASFDEAAVLTNDTDLRGRNFGSQIN
ncbi:MAG TPA: hypothetical protein VHS80_04480 [Chthoniobacterales bacterium]|nr:hypothetical protein [Chthoniobacterales bacterium]